MNKNTRNLLWTVTMYASLFATLTAAHKENYVWWTIFMGLLILSVIQTLRREK